MSNAEEDIISAKEEFFVRLGKAVAAWSYVETTLCSWFERLTTMHPLVARKIFYSQTGFGARKSMFLAVVNSTNIKPDISDYLRAIINKASDYSGARNKIVHGDVLTVDSPESKYFKSTIILQGRQQWLADPPPDDVLTSDDLINIRDHFAALATFNIIGLNWNANPDESPLRFVELIRGLPNPPHSKRLDPNVLGSHTLYDTDLRFRR